MGFNKRHFSDLKAVLNDYKASIDAILKGSRVDEKLKEVYSPEYFQRVKDAALSNAKKSMDEKRTATQTRINSIVKALRDDVASWVNADVDQNLLSRLQAVKTLGAKLSRTDIELYAQQSAGKYLETKILSGIAADNGFVINTPSAENYLKEIAEIESGCNALLNMYCGSNLEGVDMLPHNFVNGIDYGKYNTWMCINADYVLKPNSVLNDAESRWGDSMVHVEKKAFLTDAETEKINKFYEGYESKAADRTKDLLAVNPGLKELIALSQYSEFLSPEN